MTSCTTSPTDHASEQRGFWAPPSPCFSGNRWLIDEGATPFIVAYCAVTLGVLALAVFGGVTLNAPLTVISLAAFAVLGAIIPGCCGFIGTSAFGHVAFILVASYAAAGPAGV